MTDDELLALRAEVEQLTERNNKLVIEAGAYDDLLAEMRQRAEAAEAQVERLTRERDEANEMHRTMCDLALHRANEIEAAESALATVTRERDDYKDDYFRRHKDACDRYEEIVVLKSALAIAQKRVGELQTALEEIASNTSSLGDALDTACNALQRKRVAIAGKEPGNG